MAKAIRRRETVKDSAEVAAPGKIKVTNLLRNRPLSFHFSGGSARLGPLQHVELDGRCLSSPELAHLASVGAIRVTASRPGPDTAGDDVKSDPDITEEK